MEKMMGLINGLMLFQSMEVYDFDAQHDIIRAGPSRMRLMDDQIADLKKWGWHHDEEYDCWGFFT